MNWKWAFGELLIIAAGVLVALAIDQWNADRLERREERLVLQQLAIDVREDIRLIQWIQEEVSSKEASLRRIQAALLEDPANVDAVEFLSDVVNGANFGWNQSKVERATFDQLLGSGEFRLIENAQLRRIIASYYTDWTEYAARADERETAYPASSYRLVPRGKAVLLADTTDGQIDTLGFDPTTSPERIQVLVRDVYASELPDHVVAELNFSLFLQGMMNDLLRDAEAVVHEIEAYLEKSG